MLDGQPVPERKRIEIPRYAEKSRKSKDKRKSSIFTPRPREVPSGG